MSLKPRVIIVGGGFGGLAAARALERADAEVVLIDRHNHHLFQPLLYQVATAALSPGNIAAPIRKILAAQENCQVVMAEVTEVDLERRQVTLVDQPWAYDYLILAAGARTNYFGNDEWARHAPGLKTIEEAIDVRSRFLLAFEQAEMETDPAARQAALTFAIVGGGPTGVEMAGALAEISRHTLRRDFRHFDTTTARVLLVEAVDQVLPGFDPELGNRARRDLEELGVEVLTGTTVIDLEEDAVTVRRDGAASRIAAHNVIWAAGVQAEALAETLGVETDRGGRVVVGDDLTIPGHPEVFVVGDLAFRVDPRTDEPVPGVAQGAIQMGRFAGRAIARELADRRRGREPPPRTVFVYEDKGTMATIGRNRAVAEVRGWKLKGVVAFLAWALIHILQLIDFRRRLTTLAEWAWMYVFYERGVRLITGPGRLPRPVRPAPDPRLTGPADEAPPVLPEAPEASGRDETDPASP